MPNRRKYKHKKGSQREGNQERIDQPDVSENKENPLEGEQEAPVALAEGASATEESDEEKHSEVNKEEDFSQALERMIAEFKRVTNLESVIQTIEDKIGQAPFECSISLASIFEMEDPVIASNGYIYEKESILDNMQRKPNINPRDNLPFIRHQPIPAALMQANFTRVSDRLADLIQAHEIPEDLLEARNILVNLIQEGQIHQNLIRVSDIPTDFIPAKFIIQDLLSIHAQLQQSALEQFNKLARQMHVQKEAAAQQASEQREKLKVANSRATAAEAHIEQQKNEITLIKQAQESTQTALSNSETGKEQLKNELGTVKTKLTNVQLELTQVQNKSRKLKETNTIKNERIIELEEQNATQKRALQKSETTNKNLANQNAESEKQLEESRAIVQKYKEFSEVRTNQATELRSENIKLQDENATLKAELEQLRVLLSAKNLEAAELAPTAVNDGPQPASSLLNNSAPTSLSLQAIPQTNAAPLSSAFNPDSKEDVVSSPSGKEQNTKEEKELAPRAMTAEQVAKPSSSYLSRLKENKNFLSYSILLLCTYLGPKISVQLLEELIKNSSPDLDKESHFSTKIKSAVRNLSKKKDQNGFLLTLDAFDSTITMDPKRQEALRQKCSQNEQEEHIEYVVKALEAIIVESGAEAYDALKNPEQAREIRPHLETVIDHIQQINPKDFSQETLRQLYSDVAYTYSEKGSPEELQKRFDYLFKAHIIRQKQCVDPENIDLLPSLVEVAVASKPIDLNRALEIAQRAWRISQKHSASQVNLYINFLTQHFTPEELQGNIAHTKHQELYPAPAGEADLLAVSGIGMFNPATTACAQPSLSNHQSDSVPDEIKVARIQVNQHTSSHS
jgi:hypothetical protein